MRDVEIKNTAIEGLRGVAALFVFFNHLPFAANALGADRTAQFGLSSDVLLRASHFGEFGVQIFFCITGYLFWDKLVLSGKATDWSTFYRNRILRLVPAFLFSAFAVAVCGLSLSGWHINISSGVLAQDIISVFSLGLFLRPSLNGVDITYFNSVNWTLAYEWGFYFLLPFIISLSRNILFMAFGIAGLLLYVMVCDQGKFLVLFFFAGALVAVWQPAVIQVSRSKAHVGTILLVAVATMWILAPKENLIPNVLAMSGSMFLAGTLQIVLVVAMTSLAFIIAVRWSPSLLTNRLFGWLGTISYSFYLLHAIVLQVSLRAFSVYQPLDSWSRSTFVGWAMFALVGALIVASTSYVCIEKPFIKHKRPERK